MLAIYGKKNTKLSVSDLYYAKTGNKYLYNLTSLENIPSIISNGILCFNYAKEIDHKSIALSGVQERRSQIEIPGGLKLHDYANLYFTYNNPMSFLRKDDAESLCFLVISSEVLNLNDCIVTDRNAATSLARFFKADEGINHLNFNKIFDKYWNDTDFYAYIDKKAIKCAEVLVPYSVSYDYILGAYVVSDEVASILKSYGFDKKIIVDPTKFYR